MPKQIGRAKPSHETRIIRRNVREHQEQMKLHRNHKENVQTLHIRQLA
jgi:hypothetical protein